MPRFAARHGFEEAAEYWPVSEPGAVMICCGVSMRDQRASQPARTGAKIENIVGVANRVFIMLDD